MGATFSTPWPAEEDTVLPPWTALDSEESMLEGDESTLEEEEQDLLRSSENSTLFRLIPALTLGGFQESPSLQILLVSLSDPAGPGSSGVSQKSSSGVDDDL